MTQHIDDLNQLGYVSSSPDFAGVTQESSASPEDIADYTTLQHVLRLIKDRKKYYASVESLSLGEHLTIENQLLVNKKVVFHLQELESLIENTVTKVKETINER